MVRAENDSAFYRILQESYTLYIRKNQQYGNSIEETGVIGAVVEIVAKTARLRELVLHHHGAGSQAPDVTRDNLQDLLNYAAIGLLMLDKSNYRGRDIPQEPGEAK